MGIRDYLKDPTGRRDISQAIRGAFDRKRGAAGTSGRILVIDADPLTRETLVRALQRVNYQVVGTGDDDEALGLVGKHPFDLVIAGTSWHEHRESKMWAGLRRLSSRTRVLAVASQTDLDQTARSCGATHTLVKPFDSEQLLRAIKNALHQD
mgnify:CR=1 FL=1